MIEILNWLRDHFRAVVTQEGHHKVKVSAHPPDWVVDKDVPQRNQRAHRFQTLATFAEWLNRHASPKATEILVDDAQVGAALTPTVPLGDVVMCQLKIHPRLERWVAVFGKPLDQRTFHRLAVTADEDFVPVIDRNGAVVSGGGEWVAGEIAKLRVQRGSEYVAELDERGVYKVRGGTDKTEVSGKIPSRLKLRVPVYMDVGVADDVGEIKTPIALYDLEVFVDLDTEADPKNPTFRLDAPGLPMVRYAARADAAAWLRHLLAEGFLVGVGALNLQTGQDFTL